MQCAQCNCARVERKREPEQAPQQAHEEATRLLQLENDFVTAASILGVGCILHVALGGALSAVQLFGRLAVLETHTLRY